MEQNSISLTELLEPMIAPRVSIVTEKGRYNGYISMVGIRHKGVDSIGVTTATAHVENNYPVWHRDTVVIPLDEITEVHRVNSERLIAETLYMRN